ncbi:hypothetical protein ACE6H2_022034 [Prunus campanulata]
MSFIDAIVFFASVITSRHRRHLPLNGSLSMALSCQRSLSCFIEASDVVKNKVSFSAFGFLDGEVSLTGKLKVLDDKWIQVLFEPPKL